MSDRGLAGAVLAAGLYNVGFAAFHVGFWRLFRWPRTLAPAGALNSAITQTLNVVLTYVFVVAGGALIWCWMEARDASLLMTFGAGFWALRAALQPLLFDMRPVASKMILLIFVAGAVIHAIPLLTWLN